MQIGYLLYIDLIIFIAMAYSVIHYFSSSNRSTSINLSSYFKFSLYVLFTITLLDTFFSGHFFLLKSRPVCMALIILYLILQTLLPYSFFLITLDSSKKTALLKHPLFSILTIFPAFLYSMLLIVTPFFNILLKFRPAPGMMEIIYYPAFTIIFYAIYIFYLCLIIYFCFNNKLLLSGEHLILMTGYVIIMTAVLLINANSEIQIPYHIVSAFYLFSIYISFFSKSFYRNSQTMNEYNRNRFINVISDYLNNDKHFIVIAVVIDHFEELQEKYGTKNTSSMLRNIQNFFGKIFPSNEIFHYDNLNYVFVFDNTHSIRSTGPIIDEILSVFNMPWNIKASKENLTVTISSLFCPEDSDNLTEIIDVLRNSIKEAQRDQNSSIVYGKEYIYNREKLLSNLTLENRQLQVFSKKAITSRTALEAADRKKDNFLANISHEVRTPLNSVIGLSELLLKENLSPSAQKKATDIKMASITLLDVFNDLLNYFNMESSNFEIIAAPYDINTIAHEALNIISEQANTKEITLDFSIDGSIPSLLIGDSLKLRQIIINLLKHAVFFTNEGSIKLTVNYKTAPKDNIELFISVSDTGTGIKSQYLDKIFDGLQTFDTRQVVDSKKCSLNLAVCKKLINIMNGSIEVQSTFGKGSTFTFHLLQEVADYTPISSSNEKTTFSDKELFKETFTAPNANILVVDDNRLNREVTRALLAPYKAAVTTAKSGRECLELLKQYRYDLILMDHLMPEMDGIDTKNKIRSIDGEYYKNVPIVVLTANVVSGMRSKFIQQGFAEYISKPINTVLLDSVLKKTLPDNLIIEKGSAMELSIAATDEIISKIDGMNKEEAMLHFNSRDEFIMELKKFYHNAPHILVDMEHALLSNNISVYLMYLTNLTNSAGKFGMQKLVKLGNSHEKAAQADNIDFLKKNLPFLIQAYKRFLDTLSEL